MKNKTIVRIFTIAVLLVILASSASMVFGTGSGYDNPDSYKGATSTAGGNVQTSANKVIGIVQIVGMAAAVIMLIALGIKYVAAAPGEKADIKKGAVIYIVGAVLLLGATGVLQIIKSLSGDLTGTTVG